MVTRLLVASRNRKKLAELRRVLDAAVLTGLTLVSLDDVPPFDEAPETGATFEDNALAKARDGFAATGLATVATGTSLAKLMGSIALGALWSWKGPSAVLVFGLAGTSVTMLWAATVLPRLDRRSETAGA